jgi:hypothetical protein
MWGALCGAFIGVLYAVLHSLLGGTLFVKAVEVPTLKIVAQTASSAAWRAFLFSLLALGGSFFSETRPLRKKERP